MNSLLSACVILLVPFLHCLQHLIGYLLSKFLFVIIIMMIQYLNWVEVRLSECNVSDCYTDLLKI